jgi:hypothetical protein
MADIIDGNSIQGMVSHWLKTPVNGYLGSNYGQDIKSLLQLPMSDGSPEATLQKLRNDVPILQVLPPGSTNLYAVQTYPDKTELIIEVAGRPVTVPDAD